MISRLVVFFVLLISSCANIGLAQSSPPRILESTSKDGSVSLRFDRPISQVDALVVEKGSDTSLKITPSVKTDLVSIQTPPSALPGHEFVYTVNVHDAGGNTTGISGHFWAPNASAALLKFSEIRVAGSATRPDAVELEVVKAGSLAGLCLDYTTDGKTIERLFFSDEKVTAGQFIVTALASSQHTDLRSPVHPWNFRKGLSNVKGLLSLRTSADGTIQDEFLYARDDLAAQRVLKAYQKKYAGGQDAAWTGPAFSPEGAGATRTFCRKKPWAKDFTGVASWMLVATGHASLGQANQLVPWEPTGLGPRQGSHKENHHSKKSGSLKS